MFYSQKTTLELINYRINLLRAHGEVENARLINALIREKRNIERTNESNN